jgi:hypothetical protein
MGGGYTTLYDQLLYNSLILLIQDLHSDGDYEGDLMGLGALAQPVLETDDAFQKQRKEITSLEKQVPEDMEPHDWRRQLNMRYLGNIMACLRRHGHLDSAPIPLSEKGDTYL